MPAMALQEAREAKKGRVAESPTKSRDAVLGVVTTGSNWKFLQLEEQQATIDFDEYLISHIDTILGIFVSTLQHLTVLDMP